MEDFSIFSVKRGAEYKIYGREKNFLAASCLVKKKKKDFVKESKKHKKKQKKFKN